MGNEISDLGIVMWDGAPALRLRAGPATTGNNIIESLAFNTRLQVVRALPGDWLEVSTRAGRSGYVSAQYVWYAPQHPLPEPNARLHRVIPGISGTAIAIAEREYPEVRWGQDLRFYVAVLAAANRVTIPQTVEGWKSLRFNAGQLIWVPSNDFAKALHGKVSSGSYSHTVVSAFGLERAFQRAGQLQADLRKAMQRALQYIPRAIARHAEQALVSALTSLLVMAAGAVLLLASTTAAGAAVGVLAGGATAAPGAAAGFEVGLALLEWLGLGFLLQWVAQSTARIGSAFATFFRTVWNANGNSQQLEKAAQELAEAIGIVAGVLVEALVMWASAKGVNFALGKLKGTALERAFGESRLGSWLRERTTNYNQGVSPVPGPRQLLARLQARRKPPTPELVRLAEQAYQRYARELEPARRQVAALFRGLGEVQARAKDPVSAGNRLQRAIDNFKAKVTNVPEVLANLWDAIGTRLVLSDTSPAGMNKVVGRLVEGIRSGELQITEINNLHGPGGKPYFTPEQFHALQVAAAKSGQTVRFNVSKNMDSGYTVVCAYIRHANGVRGELQIIGPKVLKIANAEHIPYDVQLHKPLIRDAPAAAIAALQKLVGPVEAAMNRMSEAQQLQYQAYLNRSYIHARNGELGVPSEPPQLPAGLDPVLSIENIQQLGRSLEGIKMKYKLPWPWAVQPSQSEDNSRGKR